jgi:hypothetical protein
MPSPSTKAVLLNLGVFQADSNIRRNLLSLTYNFSSPTASVLQNSFTLLPGESTVINTPMAVSVVTLISTSSALNASIVLAAPDPGYSIPISKLHLIDADVRQLTLTNTSSTDSAKVNIVQS